MSMNVQQQRVAVSMLCVTIHMDHTSALVTQDILETDEVVQVILESLLWTSYFTSVVYTFSSETPEYVLSMYKTFDSEPNTGYSLTL